MNAIKREYALTDKQARAVIDALSIQIRFFNRHLRAADVRYLTKVRDAMKTKRLTSSHARPVLEEEE